MGVFAYEGLYIGLPAMYHATGREHNYPNTDGFHLVQLVVSRDLKTWTRVGDRQPFLGPSRTGSGAYDLTQILPPSAPVLHDDELWFYYTGLKYRSTFDYTGSYPNGTAVPVAGRSRDVGAVCLAVLRRDGFVSLDAGTTPGVVVTRPFTLPDGRMFVNANARGGELRVEAVSEDGKTLARSRPISCDSTRQPVEWETGNGDLAPLAGRQVALRFTLREVRLYAYGFTEPPLSATTAAHVHPVLIRNAQNEIVELTVTVKGDEPVGLHGVRFALEGTDDLADVETLELLGAGDTPFGKAAPAVKSVEFRGEHPLLRGPNVFQLSCRLKASADLSNRVGALCARSRRRRGPSSPWISRRVGRTGLASPSAGTTTMGCTRTASRR